MRLRFSMWDLVVAAGVVAEIWSARWLMANLEGPVPLHWGLTGEPDRFGDPSWLGMLMGPAIAAALYLMLRLVDGVHAVRRPEVHGFLTGLGGGMAVGVLVLGALVQLATWGRRLVVSPLEVVGAMFLLMGWQMLRAREIPVNAAGLVPDTPAARDAVRRTMGWGLAAVGAATVALAWLPGIWSAFALLPLLVGPLAALVVAVVRAQRTATGAGG